MGSDRFSIFLQYFLYLTRNVEAYFHLVQLLIGSARVLLALDLSKL